MSEPIHIISLGAGVQSSVMALLASLGMIKPMPVVAIFADTKREPKAVYEWLDWLAPKLAFPVKRVCKGDLGVDSLKIIRSKKTGRLYIKGLIPAFVLNPDGTKAILGRKCTADYKIEMIVREARTLCAWKRGTKEPLVKMLIGISTDEAIRMKPARHDWIENTWPLLDMSYSRARCLSWMKENGFPEPPRSACNFCPFHSDDEWLRIKADEYEWNQVVQYERALQAAALKQEALKGIPFLHRSCVTIDQVVFKSGHGRDLFNMGDCEGMCGV